MNKTSNESTLNSTAVEFSEGVGDDGTDTRELYLLEEIERDPDVTQASLAAQLGVAVGTVNWLLKRFIDKGYVKVKRLQRRKLRYIITPEGLAFRARLTLNYIDTSLRLYRRVREQVRKCLKEVKQAGYSQIEIRGNGDLADICKLTCLEFDVTPIMYEGPTSIESREMDGSGSPEDAKPLPNTTSIPRQMSASIKRLPVLEIHGTKVTLYMENLQS